MKAEEKELTGLELHISRVDYAGDKSELVGILKGERSAYMAGQALKLMRVKATRSPDNIRARIADLKAKHQKDSADYQSLQISMRKRQIQSVDRVANNLSMLAAYERVLGDVGAELEELEAIQNAEDGSNWSYQWLTTLLSARVNNEIPTAVMAQRLGVPIEDLLSVQDKLRIELAAKAEKEAQAAREAEYAARFNEKVRLEAETKTREAEELAAVEQWDVEQLISYAFDGKPPADVFYHFFPTEGQHPSISELHKEISNGFRAQADSLSSGFAVHYVQMRYRCFERLHEMIDAADKGSFRRYMQTIASRGLKSAHEAAIDPIILEAVEGWSVEELVNHVFQGKPPKQVEIEFLAELPGGSERRSVELALQEKEKSNDAIVRRAAARLLETLYENGRLYGSRSRALQQKWLVDQARVASGNRIN